MNEQAIKERLLAMIGEPYEPPDGCLRFVRKALLEIGVKIEGSREAIRRDARLFRPIEHGDFGTVVIFRSFDGLGPFAFHVGLMLDRRWCMQSSESTNGVARIEITRFPWANAIRGFYGPRILDAKCF